MAEYTDDLALIVRYDGTKDAFDAVKSNYLGKVVFITGSSATGATTDEKKQAIWVSNGVGGKYLDMANVEYIRNNLTHISGITVDGKTYYPSSGGGAITLAGANGIAVTVNTTTGTVTFDGKDLKADLIGTTGNGSNTSAYPDTITGAKAYTDKVAGDLKGTKATGDTTAETIRGAKDYADAKVSDAKTELKGTKADGDTTEETIRGAKDYADKVAASKASAAKDEAIQEAKNYVDPKLANKADLEDGKIKESQLPDYIFGQMLFGGTITAGGANTMEVSPSAKLLDKVDKPSTTSSLTINKTDASTYEGAYFIVTGNLTSIFGFPVVVGDWIVSTGQDWRKVDNTDAIVKVAGVTPVNGDINASALAQQLAATGDANELALKSEVDAKYTKPDEGIPKTHLAAGVQTALDLATNSIHGVATADPKYIDVTASVEEGGKQIRTIKAVTAPITSENATTDGLATVADIRAYLAARFSVKVVS